MRASYYFVALSALDLRRSRLGGDLGLSLHARRGLGVERIVGSERWRHGENRGGRARLRCPLIRRRTGRIDLDEYLLGQLDGLLAEGRRVVAMPRVIIEVGDLFQGLEASPRRQFLDKGQGLGPLAGLGMDRYEASEGGLANKARPATKRASLRSFTFSKDLRVSAAFWADL